jgi:hypothetical protein
MFDWQQIYDSRAELPPLEFSESALIDACPERVYALLRDYEQGHPRILPPQFLNYTVEQGGQGAGTVIRFELGHRNYRGEVEEPEPGRLLVERYRAQQFETRFIVEPVDNALQSKVTFQTIMPGRRVLAGLYRWTMKMMLAKMYRQELRLLNEVLQERQHSNKDLSRGHKFPVGVRGELRLSSAVPLEGQ